MATREATCLCGQLRLSVEGEPFAVSICNCLACQRRTGSAFGMQAGFKADQVTVEGRYSDYSRISDEAEGSTTAGDPLGSGDIRAPGPSERLRVKLRDRCLAAAIEGGGLKSGEDRA